MLKREKAEVEEEEEEEEEEGWWVKLAKFWWPNWNFPHSLFKDLIINFIINITVYIHRLFCEGEMASFICHTSLLPPPPPPSPSGLGWKVDRDALVSLRLSGGTVQSDGGFPSSPLSLSETWLILDAAMIATPRFGSIRWKLGTMGRCHSLCVCVCVCVWGGFYMTLSGWLRPHVIDWQTPWSATSS